MRVLLLVLLLLVLARIGWAQEDTPLDPGLFGDFGAGFSMRDFNTAMAKGHGAEALGILLTLIVTQVRRMELSAMIPRRFQSLATIVFAALFAVGGSLAAGLSPLAVAANALMAAAVPFAAFRLKDDSQATVGEIKRATRDLPRMPEAEEPPPPPAAPPTGSSGGS